MSSPERSLRLLLSTLCASALLLEAAPALPQQPESLIGTWQGLWKRADGDARMVLTIEDAGRNSRGAIIIGGTFNLADQPGMSIPLLSPTLQGSRITSIAGQYDGTLSADGNTITGFMLRDGNRRELNLTRVPPGAASWEIRTPTPDEIHQYLQTSYNRSALIADNATPFHLVAQIDFFKSDERSPSSHATIEELWRDPLHWKLTITYDGSTFTEVNNGTSAYTVGNKFRISLCCSQKPRDWDPFDDVLPRVEEALFSPFRPELLTTRRLTLSDRHAYMDCSLKSRDQCPCITAEPELAGLSSASFAQTKYCLAPYDLALHRADLPVPTGWFNPTYTYSIVRYDVAPFGAKNIARTVDVGPGDGRHVRVHITTLEAATDFSTITAPRPRGANRSNSRRQDVPPPDEVMTGGRISAPNLRPFLCAKPAAKGVVLRLHINVRGEVTSSDVLSDPDRVMTRAASEEIKKARYRVSYKDGRPVAVDRIVSLGPCFS
jgi:hypothetical protein